MFRKLLYVWFSFRGNIDRAIYLLYYVIPMVILFSIAGLIPYLFGRPTLGEEFGVMGYRITAEDNLVAAYSFYVIFFILLIGVTCGQFASGVKRLHDMAASGWWILFMLFPLNIILLVVLIFVPSVSERNTQVTK